MKKGICTKCGHNEVIRSAPAEYVSQGAERPMCVTADPRWLMPGRNPSYGHGVLELYTCRRCGYSEWYAVEPENIPTGPEYKTEVVRGGQGG